MSSLTCNTSVEYVNVVNAVWEIDSAMLERKETITTESKTVEGMPDVKWSLKYVPLNTNGGYNHYGHRSESAEIYLIVESASKISFQVENTRGQGARVKRPRTNSYVCDEILCGRGEYCVEYLNGWKGYLSDGKLQIQFSATFSYTNQTSSGIPKLLNSNAWGLRLKENNSEDFSIIVEKQTIAIHKNILSAESPVFKQMFEGNFVEAKKNQVTITDCKYEIVQAAINYCYAQDIATCFENDENVHGLLTFVDKYDFQTLKPAMEKYLTAKLTKSNVSFYASAADKANALELRKACVEFVKTLLQNRQTFTATEMTTFDTKFLADVMIQAMAKGD